MGAELFVIGLSWRTAPVAVREQLAFGDDELSGALTGLCALPAVEEAMLISTCNRVELYGATAGGAPVSALAEATAEARSFLSRAKRFPAEKLAEVAYEYTGAEAIRHVFRVASALDSLVVGEAQILGQLKAAYGVAVGTETTGVVLARCLERSFGVAKRVRSETGVSRGAANISSVAVELARHVFVDLAGKTVLVVGAGKMSALAVRHLRSAGAGAILVTNRSPDKATALADEVGGVARPWRKLPDLIALADVVISSTGSTEPVLTRGLLKKAMRRRRYRSIVIIDIAVPRDADPAIGKLDGVYLFDIDDLQRVVAANVKEREKEARAAGSLVDSEVTQFEQWLRSHRVVPTIKSLRERFHAVAAEQAERTIRTLQRDHSPDERDKAIRRLAQIIVNKLLHTPMTALKAGTERDIDALVSAANRLFALPIDTNGGPIDTNGGPIDTNGGPIDKNAGPIDTDTRSASTGQTNHSETDADRVRGEERDSA